MKKFYLTLIISSLIFTSCSSNTRPENLNNETMHYLPIQTLMDKDIIFNTSEEKINFKVLNSYLDYTSILLTINSSNLFILDENSKLEIAKDDFNNSIISFVSLKTQYFTSYPLYYSGSSFDENNKSVDLNFYSYNPIEDGAVGTDLPTYHYFFIKLNSVNKNELNEIIVNFNIQDYDGKDIENNNKTFSI